MVGGDIGLESCIGGRSKQDLKCGDSTSFPVRFWMIGVKSGCHRICWDSSFLILGLDTHEYSNQDVKGDRLFYGFDKESHIT